MLDDRADGDLCIREQLLDRIGQQVGRGVANDFQSIGVFAGDDGQRTVGSHLEAGVHDLAVDLASQSGLGQTGADRCSDLGHGDRARKFTLRTVGKRNVDHGMCLKRVLRKAKSAERSALYYDFGS